MNLRWLLLIFLLSLIMPAMAQQQTVSIDADKQALSQIVEQLASSYNLKFAYSSDQVNLNRMVTIHLKDVPLNTALRKLFDGTGINYTINDNQVVLYKDPNQRYTISGYVREKGTGELLIGVIVGVDPPKAGSVSNTYGFYSITLPADTYIVQFNYLGFKPFIKKLVVDESLQLDVELEAGTSLDEIVVKAQSENLNHSLDNFEVPLKEINRVPMILGEKDVVKYIMLMPGIQKGNEGNSYMYVRGGGPDQNLVLIDDAVIYNAYHYLGLASLFSGTELRRAELIKGGFSSKYGGRLSSVLDMSMKDGNREQFGGEATIGAISSRLSLEGPIQKNKSSYFISFRKSYIDKMSHWLVKDQDQWLDYNYYDLHAKVSTDIGKKDRLMLSGYFGNDQLASSSDVSAKNDGITWGSRAATLRWNHQYNGKLFSNTSLVYSYYRSRTAFSDQSSSAFNISAVQSTINDFTLKYDMDYIPSGYTHIKAGAGVTKHYFSPLTSYVQSGVATERRDDYTANEAFAYMEISFQLTQRLKVVPGLRMSYYKNQVSYTRAEPRLSGLYTLPHNWSLNATYALMNQYQHLISSFSGLGMPSDVWTSTDATLKPQQAQVVSAGVYKNNIKKSRISIGVEGYYKHINDMALMKDGASFFQLLPLVSSPPSIANWNELLTQGKCNSYGVEFIVRKEGEHFSGWISYTLSKTTIQAEEVNRGRPYPATYDRRHDLGVYGSYRTGKHFTFSANWVYGTGNAITLPVGEFFPAQQMSLFAPTVYDYENKNSFRMKAYHRLDLSAQFMHSIGNRVNSIIELSVYNVYNRANPFFYEITDDGNPRKLKQVSLFPIMPSISWTLKF